MKRIYFELKKINKSHKVKPNSEISNPIELNEQVTWLEDKSEELSESPVPWGRGWGWLWSHSGGAGLGLLVGGFRKQFLCLMRKQSRTATSAALRVESLGSVPAALPQCSSRLAPTCCATYIDKSTENDPDPPLPGTQHPNWNLVFVDTNKQPGFVCLFFKEHSK